MWPLKNADLIYDVCITQGKNYVPGHQEIEIGLAKLYRVTGEKRYLELAKHLLDIRAEVLDVEYSQAHLPVTEQSEAVGHAVRANYMYSAMADVAALTGDPCLPGSHRAGSGTMWWKRSFPSPEEWGPVAMGKPMAKTMNYPTIPTMRPVQPLPMYTGTTGCSCFHGDSKIHGCAGTLPL